MKSLILLLLFALPSFAFTQSQPSVWFKVLSLEELELSENQIRFANRIDQQYQERLKEAMKIITIDRKEAHLKIAFAILNANEQYLGMLDSEQRRHWEIVSSAKERAVNQKGLQLNSEGRSRTVALVVR